jgi:hypothetical protein
MIIKSPKKHLETYCFCSISYYYYYYYYSPPPFFLSWHLNLSTADLRNYWTEFHETRWNYRYMFLVGPKVFSFVVKGVAVLWWPFWKWRPVEIFRCQESIRDIIEILKMQNCSSNGDLSLCQILCLYHYPFRSININVQNFNFPMGFYSNPHPLWTPQNMTLTPFTTKLKTLGPTRNIYL